MQIVLCPVRQAAEASTSQPDLVCQASSDRKLIFILVFYRLRWSTPINLVIFRSQRHDNLLTHDSQDFITSQVHEKYGAPVIKHGILTYSNPVRSLVRTEDLPATEWQPGYRRAGVIAKKIGIYPMWLKDGTKITTTLLQVVDNHVIKYTPPEQYQPAQRPRVKNLKKWGCLLVGALSTDPTLLTKEYAGLFTNSGVMPKAVLHRFLISPEAALVPGTPLTASHFRVGDFVDVRGLTVDRGFQGVMKRWGFHGMPATHGVCKTHRRPGNIGTGSEKARVIPGTKLPGNMGNRWRYLKGLRIWRINTKYNILYVSGQNVAGDTNGIVYIYDTILPLRKPKTAPPFPTMIESDDPLQEDIYHPDLHDWREPTIMFAKE